MKFKIWYPGYKKFYAYSDHPHLRRSNFLEKFGRYSENTKGGCYRIPDDDVLPAEKRQGAVL